MQTSSALLEAVKNGRYRQAKLLVDTASGRVAGDVVGAATSVATGVLDFGKATCSTRSRTLTPPLVAACLHMTDEEQRGSARARFARLLLHDAHVNPNARDVRGMTALMHAAILGQTDIVLMLLAHSDTDLELQDDAGNTALMHAAANGHADIVSKLLDQMGRLKQVLQLSLRNDHGLTALELAELGGHSRVSVLLGHERPTGCGYQRASKDKFAAPEQLDRDPTPKSPYDNVVSTSFPIRWQQRKALEKKQQQQQQQQQQQDIVEFDKKGSQILDQTSTHEMMTCSLPRLTSKEMKRTASKEDVGMQSLHRTSRNVDLRNRKVEATQQNRDQLMAPFIDLRRSHSEPRNTSTSDNRKSSASSSSSSSSSSLDRFQQVLNVLDASINDGEQSKRSNIVRDTNVESQGAARAGQWNRGFEALKEYRFTQNLQGRYFPPIRPIQTTVSLPGDHKIDVAWNAKKM